MRKIFLFIAVIALVLALSPVIGCSSIYDDYALESELRPNHYGDDGFTNPHTNGIDKNAIDFFQMRWFGDEEWADQTTETDVMPVQALSPQHFMQRALHSRVTWLGHATFVIDLNGQRIITDPIFSERASPFSFAGPERMQPPPIDASQLPRFDAVVISHNHYDHLDQATIQQLAKQDGGAPIFIVPLALKPWFLEQGVAADQVIELDWWESHQYNGITYTATPSQHWSARSLFDRMQSLWASWHINAKQGTVWFGGDTGYNDVQFKDIGERLAPIDLALIPIGAYEPRWFMKAQHTNPTDAIQLHQDLQAKHSLAMHFGSYQLAAEGLQQTFDDLAAAKRSAELTDDDFTTLPIGGWKMIK